MTIAADGNDDSVVLVRVLHLVRVVGRRHIHLVRLLQHGGDHHEDDQQHEHDVGHGMTLGDAIWAPACGL